MRFPVWEGKCGFAFEEVARRSGDFALAGVAAAVELGPGDVVQRASLGLLGMGGTPVRPTEAEQSILGRVPTAADLDEVAALAMRDLDPPDDVHASAAYRSRIGRHLVGVTLSRAIEEARRS